MGLGGLENELCRGEREYVTGGEIGEDCGKGGK